MYKTTNKRRKKKSNKQEEYSEVTPRWRMIKKNSQTRKHSMPRFQKAHSDYSSHPYQNRCC